MIRIFIRVAILALLALVSSSCGRRNAELYEELKEVIARKDSIDAGYERVLSELKIRLSEAESDSIRWELTEMLRQKYRCFNIDSCLFYTEKSVRFASNPRQAAMSQLSKAEIQRIHHNYYDAGEILVAIDTTIFVPESADYENFYRRTLYLLSMIRKHSLRDRECFDALFNEYYPRYVSTVSSEVDLLQLNASISRTSGDIVTAYENSLKLYEHPDATLHQQAWAADVISDYYRAGQNLDQREKWCVLASIADLQVPVREGGATWKLSEVLLKRGRYDDALRMIQLSMDNILLCNYPARLMRISRDERVITNAVIKHENNLLKINILLLVLLFCTVITLIVLFVKRTRHARLLHLANQDKQRYLTHYMEMCTEYMNQVDQTRSMIRRAMRKEGQEGAEALLRMPSYVDKESKAFMKRFDETFLNLFPDFVEGVNKLLDADHQLTLREDGALSTELRILAAIRMGMTESGKIARFLNCSPTTVYTYRTKLKAAVTCDKDAFEEEIMNIQK